jgi:hypothetical protein
MTNDRRRLLERRLREAVRQQPEMKTLRRLLLKIGGVQLVAPPNADLDLQFLIESGFVMVGPVKRKVMRESACHENVARLWKAKKYRLVAIGTGYALSDDGLWRQHSWGFRREGILETSIERERYFGVVLYGSQADCFAESTMP